MTEEFRRELIHILPDIKRFSLGFCGGRADEAGDLCQDTIEQALRSHHTYAAGTNMKGWIYTLMSNLNRNSSRKRRSRARHEAFVEAPDCAVEAEQDSVAEWTDTKRVIDRLSPEHKLALMLVAYDGESYASAAATLGCEVGTVKSRVSRARALIKQALEENDAERRREAAPAPTR